MKENLNPLMNLDQIHTVIDLLAEIQNKEIGTVFLDIAGHIEQAGIRIYSPAWQAGRAADAEFSIWLDSADARDAGDDIIGILQKIIETGELPNAEEKRRIERERRREQFEKLKQEFESETPAA